MDETQIFSNPIFLHELAQACIQEIKTSIKQPHESHDAYLGRCWMVAFYTMLNKHNLNIRLEKK